MPPKKATLDELVSALSDKLDALSVQQTEHFEKMEKKVEELEKLVKGLKDENVELKATINTLQEDNLVLKTKLLHSEQHSRRNNIRILNFQVDGDARDGDALGDEIYEKALLPILRGAVSKKRLREVPTREKLICSAHLLPGKEGKPNPIICRLVNNYYRTVILQCKRDFAPRSAAPHPSTRPPPYRYPIFEDVAAELFRFSQKLAAHSSVDAAWIAGGAIRDRLSGSESVLRVKSIFIPIDELLA